MLWQEEQRLAVVITGKEVNMLDLESAIKHCKEKAEELKHQYGELANKHPELIEEQMRLSQEKHDCWVCAEEHEQLAEWLKELKGLRLLAEWAVQCGFGYDNIPEEYEKYKNIITDLDYIEGLIYIAKKEAENNND